MKKHEEDVLQEFKAREITTSYWFDNAGWYGFARIDDVRQYYCIVQSFSVFFVFLVSVFLSKDLYVTYFASDITLSRETAPVEPFETLSRHWRSTSSQCIQMSPLLGLRLSKYSLSTSWLIRNTLRPFQETSQMIHWTDSDCGSSSSVQFWNTGRLAFYSWSSGNATSSWMWKWLSGKLLGLGNSCRSA